MSRVLIVIVIVIAVALTGILVLPKKKEPHLIVLSGAGMKVPVSEIAEKFEEETGNKVILHFDGSSILRNYIIKFKKGDIFLPGDEKNLDALYNEGLVQEDSFVAWHIVSILVSPDYNNKVTGLEDLTQEGIRLAISNPKMASLGRLVMERVINKHPLGQEILKNVVVYSSSTADTLNLYKQGNIDAIIEWDVMAKTPDGKGLIVVDIEDPYMIKDPLRVGLLKTSENPEAAKLFYDYFTTKGLEVFRKHGYSTER